MFNPIEKKTFIYHFDQQSHYMDYPQLHSIGWETRTTNAYKFDCERSDIHQLLFQYTLNGEGHLSIHNRMYRIKPGEAFLIEKPGPYRYWLSENSPVWDFIFISFTLESAPYWDKIISRNGHLVTIPMKSKVIKLWKKIYMSTLEDKLDNFFQGSIYAYQFLLELTNCLDQNSTIYNQKTHVQKCLQEIQKHYDKELTVENLAHMCGISTSYLSHLFHMQLGKSINNYLCDYRITQSCALLRHSQLSISEIAKKVGYCDPNYFSRVFKQRKQITPSEYRASFEKKTNFDSHTYSLVDVD